MHGAMDVGGVSRGEPGVEEEPKGRGFLTLSSLIQLGWFVVGGAGCRAAHHEHSILAEGEARRGLRLRSCTR